MEITTGDSAILNRRLGSIIIGSLLISLITTAGRSVCSFSVTLSLCVSMPRSVCLVLSLSLYSGHRVADQPHAQDQRHRCARQCTLVDGRVARAQVPMIAFNGSRYPASQYAGIVQIDAFCLTRKISLACHSYCVDARRYHAERALAERGWNTWLSGLSLSALSSLSLSRSLSPSLMQCVCRTGDMLTHALLPHGIAVSIGLHAGSSSVSALCSQGPSCDLAKFPAKHGLHATRGEYTEIESVQVGNGTEFRVETAASESGNLSILITTLALPKQQGDTSAPAVYAVITLAVPEPYKPRLCNVTAEVGGELRGDCPGLPAVRVSAAAGTVSSVTSSSTLHVVLSPQVGGQVALQALVSQEHLGAANAGVGEKRGVEEEARRASLASIDAVVSAARAALLQSFAQYGARNETFAGMQTSISWNVIYTPYEAIFTFCVSVCLSVCRSVALGGAGTRASSPRCSAARLGRFPSHTITCLLREFHAKWS